MDQTTRTIRNRRRPSHALSEGGLKCKFAEFRLNKHSNVEITRKSPRSVFDSPLKIDKLETDSS